ncbi:hypothetical protein BG006_011375 [Podila minutissima]|uniref:ABC transporter domain-containing protein n=1 Tax=Podila minutissima TaxID=64525 RepID=A0A9P5SEL4_9FUNG|nr:hypothetical protein BG006_011375 [Podila minutissima]
MFIALMTYRAPNEIRDFDRELLVNSTALVSLSNKAVTTLVDGNDENSIHLVALTIKLEGTHSVTVDAAPTIILERMSTMDTTIQELCRLANYGRMLLQTHEVGWCILDEVSLTFPPGELTAVLRASGAGKTSLKSAVLKRGSLHLSMLGAIWFNGSKNPSLCKVNTVFAYVRQEHSFLFTHLTVRETLQYAAALSMNKNLAKSERVAKVEALMDL